MVPVTRITVVGSSNTDMILRLPRIPRPGESILGGEFSVAAGGKGANQAVAASRLGGRVSLVACLGSDMFGDQALAGFKEAGIDVSCVVRDRQVPSGTAFIFVDAGGENSIGVANGANARLSVEHIQSASEVIGSANVVLLQLENPVDSIAAAAAIGSARGARIILNPAPACPIPAELLRHVSILTPNEHEAALLSGISVDDIPSAARAAAALRNQGPDVVIVTLGAAGAYVLDGDGGRLVPAFKVSPVDTTAAGDTFNGALAVAIAEGKPLLDAVRFGNAAAALSVTRVGAQPSIPTRAEVEALLRT